MIRKFLCLILLLFLVFSVSADSNGIWHFASDIRGGIFGSDEMPITNYTFKSRVYFENEIFISKLTSIENSNYFLDLNSNSNFKQFSSNVGIVKNFTVQNNFIANSAEIQKGLKLGFESICDLSKEGTLRYNSSIKQMEFCNGEIWSPFSSTSGSGLEFVTDLVNKNHTKIECEALGGEVVHGEVEGVYMCRFDAVSCPTDWTQYEDWSTTKSGSSSCIYSKCIANCGGHESLVIMGSGSCSRSTTSHPWSNTPVEVGGSLSCSNCNPPSATAIVTQIGCY